jgi:hypothetical protein
MTVLCVVPSYLQRIQFIGTPKSYVIFRLIALTVINRQNTQISITIVVSNNVIDAPKNTNKQRNQSMTV